MKIIDCHIENFGKLSDAHYSFEPGLNIFGEPNGSGKSTLAAFIKVMFFGFAGEGKRSVPENERKRFKPWQGGVYGGQLVFENKGSTYRIVRTFGAKDKDDTFVLYDTKTNLESDSFSTNIGEELLLIDHDSFCRTVYIAAGDCETETTDRISAKLGNLAHNTDDVNNYDTVKKKLSDMINAMSPTRKTGMIYKKKERLAALREESRGEKTVDEAVLLLKSKRDDAKQLRDSLKNRQAEIQANINRQLANTELISKKKTYGDILNRWNQAKEGYEESADFFRGNVPDETEVAEMLNRCGELGGIKRHMEALHVNEEQKAKEKLLEEQLENISSAQNKNETKKTAKLPIVMAGTLILIILGLVLSNIWLALCSLIFLIPFIMSGTKKEEKAVKENYLPDDAEPEKIREELYSLRKDRADYEKLKQDKEQMEHTVSNYIKNLGFEMETDMSAQLFSIRDKARELADAKKWYNRQEEEKRNFEENNDIESFEKIEGDKPDKLENYYNELGEVTQSLEKAIEDISDYNVRIDKALNECELIAEAGDEAKRLGEEIDRDLHRLEVITKTRDFLDRAKETFDSKYMKPVMDGFKKYYKCISGSEADAYSINARMELSVMELGNDRDIKLLSSGYRSLIGICMRMALVDAMYTEEKPFVVFDDPFVYLDEEKRRGGMDFLKILSKEYQIIYFTCNKDRGKAFEN